MGIDIRLPNINAPTEAGQLVQIKSYLYQLVEQLKWAMENMESAGAVATQTNTTAETSSAGGTNAINATNTFNAIKSLIIKSADIVDAYYQVINERLEGIYVAQSEFGTYSELTAQEIEKNSTDITQVFTNQQQISSTLEEIKNTITKVNAYIKSGLLEDGETPVYGLEVGQKNIIDGVEVFSKYARFSSDRLSFYDQNDIEVAYISDFKLHITDAEVKGNLTLGGYKIDTSNGLIFRWIGGA